MRLDQRLFARALRQQFYQAVAQRRPMLRAERHQRVERFRAAGRCQVRIQQPRFRAGPKVENAISNGDADAGAAGRSKDSIRQILNGKVGSPAIRGRQPAV